MRLLTILNEAINLIVPDQESQIILDLKLISEYLLNPNLRAIVLGPFNHGKSTLLNALLGNYTLPISLVPTTGAAIKIKYGDSLKTQITFSDGTSISEIGTDILQRFAVLDNQRRMQDNVASVEVLCPHPLLKKGVELVDLPGTNDQDEQDYLVKNQILTADLVIQVLDARKLFTLKEIENLRDWLIERKIKTVVFVINFLNLLDNDEQKSVIKRSRSIASNFRLQLPNGMSNVHRVDALPALKAKIQGDSQVAYTSGIINFEAELYNLISILSDQISEIRLPRLIAISNQIKEYLNSQAKELKDQLEIFDNKRNTDITTGRKEARQLKKNFEKSLESLIDWIAPEQLINRYQSECFEALCEDRLTDWLNNILRNELVERVELVDKWIEEAIDKLQSDRPNEIEISLPDFPEIDIPERPSEIDEPSGAVGAAIIGGIIGSSLGPWGMAAGAALAHRIVNKSSQQRKEELEQNYYLQLSIALNNGIEKYLRSFSDAVLSIVPEYRNSIKDVFIFQVLKEPQEVCKQRKLLRKLESIINDIDKNIQDINN